MSQEIVIPDPLPEVLEIQPTREQLFLLLFWNAYTLHASPNWFKSELPKWIDYFNQWEQNGKIVLDDIHIIGDWFTLLENNFDLSSD